MDGTNELKEATRVSAPVASSTLSVNVLPPRERLWSASDQSPSAKRSALTRSRPL
jgi:hypothetical protein